MEIKKKDMKRFETKFEMGLPCECWEYRGCLSCGYGSFGLSGKTKRSHRVSYSMYKGDIPPKLYVLHKCDNPSCVNPEHLFVGTQDDNMKDMLAKGRDSFSRAGARSTSVKINKHIARRIREFYRCGVGTRSLADQFSLSQRHIRDITNRKVWRSVR